MPTVWGIHNDQPGLDLIGAGFISIGWEELGDLSGRTLGRAELKALLAEAYPDAKPGAIPVWAGILTRFMTELQVGDVVISPNKADRTLSFGKIAGGFEYDAKSADLHPNRRPVTWLRTGVPRAEFSPSALHEIGSALTLFRVTRHAAEFLAFLDGTSAPNGGSEDESPEDEGEPIATRVDSYTRDFVGSVLIGLDPYRFEEFVAALLRAAGYRATVTQASGDGGIDVIVSRDPLGIEPPIIKVQCKRTTAVIGGPEVQKLIGALASGGDELGVFVTLGTYSSDAIHLERTRQNLRLVSGAGLVDLVLEHYEALTPEWKRLIPMRRVYAVDRESLEV